MKNLLKLFAWLVGITVVLVVAAVILVPMLVDPNDYRDELAARVKAHTGRDLRIGGELSMTVFPWLGVNAADVELGNAPGFSDQPFARTERVQARVKLMPLLDRRLEVDRVIIHGLQVSLERDAAGKTNWSDLAGGAAAGDGAASGTPSEPSPGAAQGLAALSVGGVELVDARLSWRDAAAGQQVVLDDLDIDTGEVSLDAPVDVKGSMKVTSSQPALSGAVSLAARLHDVASGGTIRAEGLNLELDLTGEALPVGRLVARLAADARIDAAAGRVQMPGMSLEADVSGPGLPGDKLTAVLRTDLSVDSQAQSAQLDGLKLDAEMTGDALPGGKVAALIGATIAVDGKAGTASVAGLGLQVADLKASGDLQVKGLQSSPAISGKLVVDAFNARQLLESLGQSVPETADAGVLTAVAVQADLVAGTDAVSLKPLVVKLDDSTLQGTLSVSNFAAPAVRFDLAVDGIDADRYLPPVAAAGEGGSAPASAPATPGSAAGAAAELPLDTLRALDVDGRIKLGTLGIRKLKLADLSATIKAAGGKIRLSPLAAKLYGGAYAGNIGLDVSGAEPQLSLDEKLNGIQLSPLLADLQGEDRLEGTATMQLAATASGAGPEAIKRSLGGKGSVRFTDGALKGVNVAAMIREAQARLTGGSADTAGMPQRTDFSEMGGSFVIDKGVLRNDDFAAKSPLLRLTGRGTVDLPREAIDYRATVSVVATAQGQGGKELQQLAGLDIPLKVGGTFAAPTYGLDEEAFIKALASSKLQGAIGEQKEKITQAVQEKVDQAVGDQVGKALGGTDVGSLTEKLLPGAGQSGSQQPAGQATEQAADPAAGAGKLLKGLLGN